MQYDYNNSNQLLNQNDAASFLGVKPQTLEVWRSTKRYNLKYLKIGRLVKYRMQDLLNFLEEQTKGGN